MASPEYYSGESFDLVAHCTDEDKEAQTPESLTYTIMDRDDNVVIRTATVTPDSSSYTIPVTIMDNTITGAEEKRKVIVSWTYNGGNKGDVKVYNYVLIQP